MSEENPIVWRVMWVKHDPTSNSQLFQLMWGYYNTFTLAAAKYFQPANPTAATSHLMVLNWIQADQEATAAAEVRHQQRCGRQMTS